MRVLLEARARRSPARVALPRYKQPQTAPRRDPTRESLRSLQSDHDARPVAADGDGGREYPARGGAPLPGRADDARLRAFLVAGGARDSRRRAARASRAAASGDQKSTKTS